MNNYWNWMESIGRGMDIYWKGMESIGRWMAIYWNVTERIGLWKSYQPSAISGQLHWNGEYWNGMESIGCGIKTPDHGMNEFTGGMTICWNETEIGRWRKSEERTANG